MDIDSRGQPQYEASFIDLPAEKKQNLFWEEGVLVCSLPWLYRGGGGRQNKKKRPCGVLFYLGLRG